MINLPNIEGFYLALECGHCKHYFEIDKNVGDQPEEIEEIEMSLWNKGEGKMLWYILIDTTCPSCDEWIEQEHIFNEDMNHVEKTGGRSMLDQFSLKVKDK